MLFLFVSSLAADLSAQEDPLLMKVDGEEVRISDFKYLYEKNNTSDKIDYSIEALENYADLYLNYKLKVKEAFSRRIDTIPKVKRELVHYKNQLVENYLTEQVISDLLLEETYTRLSKEVKASHILIKCESDASPEDTLKAYNKLLGLKERVENGDDFEKLAAIHSQDPSAAYNKGDLGYFTAMQMVYPFETAAYTTSKGKLSAPVRTNFGYHLIKVDDVRTARGEIEVGHILLKSDQKDPNTAENLKVAQEIKRLAKLIEEGADFEKLAKQNSQDRTTADSGGRLPKFGVGKMVPEFADAAFALKSDGDVSAPVKTKYGWHIIKRYKFLPLAGYDQLKSGLKEKLRHSKRASITKENFVEKVKAEHDFQENEQAKSEIFEVVGDEIMEISFKLEAIEKYKKEIISLGNKKYSQYDFVRYVRRNLRQSTQRKRANYLAEQYKYFVEKACMDYEEVKLKNNKDFVRQLNEYTEGIILFDLMEKEVWNKANEDSVGVEQYYASNSDKYVWKDAANLIVYSCSNFNTAKQLRKNVMAGKPTEDFIFTKEAKLYNSQKNSNLGAIELKEGFSDIIIKEDKTAFFVDVKEVLSGQPRSFDDIRGYVVADYQNDLEEKLLAELKKKYKYSINKAVLSRMNN